MLSNAGNDRRQPDAGHALKKRVLTTVLLVASVSLATVQLAVAFPALRNTAPGLLTKELVLRARWLPSTQLSGLVFAAATVRVAVADPLGIDALVRGDTSELLRRFAREIV